MKSLALFIFLFLCSPNARSEDIVIGGDDIADACPSLAAVKAKNFIYLRTAPSISANVVGKLSRGRRFLVCTEINGWYSVVVPKNDNIDCGVSTPWPTKRKFKGLCKEGWVEIRQADILAD